MSEIKNQINHSQLNNPTFIYGDRNIHKLLGSLPGSPELFLGRDDDLPTIHDRLSGGHNTLLLVNGEGGIGKTTVASAYYHRYAGFYDHLIWIVAETSIRDALMTLALELHLRFDDRAAPQEKIDAILKALRMLMQPSLLVIDNANDLEDFETFYPQLRKCANLHLLITTRIAEYARAEVYPIRHLAHEDALRLFAGHYAQYDSNDEATLKAILEAVGYNTLVIELLAKNLSNFNTTLKTRYTMSDLLQDLQRKGLLALRSDIVTTDYRYQKATPEAIISAMYDISALDEAEKSLLSVLSLLPAASIPYTMLERLLPHLSDLDQELLGIARKGWIEFDKKHQSFKCNPVVQEVVRDQNREHLVRHTETLIRSLTHELEHDAVSGTLRNNSYEEALPCVQYAETAIEHLLPLRADIALLLERTGAFYTTHGNLEKALRYFEERLRLGKELFDAIPNHVGFKNGLAIAYYKLGDFYAKTGQNPAVEKASLQQAQRLWSELAGDFRGYPEFTRNLEIVNAILQSDDMEMLKRLDDG